MAATVVKTNPPMVQQGTLPVYFVTDIAAMDLTGEYVSLTFVVDQNWGGTVAIERELSFRMVAPRSCFDRMHVLVDAKINGCGGGRH